MTADLESVLEQASRWLEEGERVALATVVGTWRSSPRPVGSQMAITAAGRFAGSVSGGCVETAVMQEAAAILAGERARTTLDLGVSSRDAWQVGLPCGGKIQIFVGEAQRATVASLVAARRDRRGLVLATDLDHGSEQIWEPGEAELLGLSSLSAAAEEVDTTIAPPPRAFIDGTASRTMRTALSSSSSNACVQAWSSNESAAPAGGPPALTNSRSTPPIVCTVFSCLAVSASAERTSTAVPITSAPVSVPIRDAACAIAASPRELIETRAPSAASPRATA
jgi:xanthine/CO dehydrogenase XdhC/CoxF family maturation factor